MAPPRGPLLSHPPSSPTDMKPPLPRAGKPTPATPSANTGELPHNPLYQAQPTTGTWPSATAATPAPSPAAAAAAPPQQSPSSVSLGRYEDTPSNFSYISLDQMDKLLAQGSNGDISSLMPFYRPAPGTLAAQPRRQAMESSEDTTTSYDNRERRLSSSSVVQSGRRKLKPSGSREFSAEEHDRMSDSTAAGRKDTAGSPAVDSPINSQLAKLQIPAKAKGAAAAAAAKEVTGTGKCMLWTHPANPTPTAPDPAAKAKKAGKKRGAGEDTKDGTRRRKLPELPQRSSMYRGVTRHRWTGRYEAHLWDSSCLRNNTTGRGRTKGRQVYLGGYQSETTAARAYDRAAIKYWGENATLNHPYDDYLAELEVMKGMTNEEYVAHLRRLSSGFSRGASNYRGVTKHHQHGRWEARIGRVMGNKYLYLGTFNSEEEAAKAYDVAAIKYRGVTAVINYSLTNYDVEAIQAAPPSFPVPADGDAMPSAVSAAAAATLGSGAGGKKGEAQAAGGSQEDDKPPLGFKVEDFLSADDLHWPGLEGESSDEVSAMMRHLTRDEPGLPELPWGDDDVVMPPADRLWPLGLRSSGSGDSGDDHGVGRAMSSPPKATRRSERAAARSQARVEPATTTAHAFPSEENIWPFQTTPVGVTDDPVSRLQSSAMQMCNALANCLQSSTSPFGHNSNSTMVVPASAMMAPTGGAHEEGGGLWDGPDEVELHNLTRIDPVGSSSNLAQFYQTGE